MKNPGDGGVFRRKGTYLSVHKFSIDAPKIFQEFSHFRSSCLPLSLQRKKEKGRRRGKNQNFPKIKFLDAKPLFWKKEKLISCRETSSTINKFCC